MTSSKLSYKYMFIGFYTDYCIWRHSIEEEGYCPGYFPYGPHVIIGSFFGFDTVQECLIHALECEQNSYMQWIKSHHTCCRLFILAYDINNDLMFSRHIHKMY
jgi:hypothetical protein